jgi:hypothetical protein
VVVVLSLFLLAVTTRTSNTVTNISSYSSSSKNGTATNTNTSTLHGTAASTTTASFSSSSSSSVSAVELEPKQEPPPRTCRRPCPPGTHRYNKIIYHNWLPTGLNDRLTVISQLANLAGWLCAVVEFPPPSYVLAHKHNHPRPPWSLSDEQHEVNNSNAQQQQQQQQEPPPNVLSPDLQWSDFIKFSFIQDNGPTTTTSQQDDDVLVKNLDMALGVSPQQGKHQRSVSPNRLRFYQGGLYKDWNHVMTKDPHNIVQNVQQLNAMVQRQYDEVLLLPQHHHKNQLFNTSTSTSTSGRSNDNNNTESYFIWTIKSNWYDALPVLQEWIEGQQQLATFPTGTVDSFPRLSRKGPGCDYVQEVVRCIN